MRYEVAGCERVGNSHSNLLERYLAMLIVPTQDRRFHSGRKCLGWWLAEKFQPLSRVTAKSWDRRVHRWPLSVAVELKPDGERGQQQMIRLLAHLIRRALDVASFVGVSAAALVAQLLAMKAKRWSTCASCCDRFLLCYLAVWLSLSRMRSTHEVLPATRDVVAHAGGLATSLLLHS